MNCTHIHLTIIFYIVNIFLCACSNKEVVNEVKLINITDFGGDEFDVYDLHPKQFLFPSFRATEDPSESVDNEGWWEIIYTRHRIFDKIRESRLFLRHLDRDVSMIHSCYEFKLVDGDHVSDIQEMSSFCYPSIIVTGVPKCSTTAMFKLLAGAPFIMTHPVKEHCPFLSQKSLLDFFSVSPKAILPGRYYLDGCIDVVGNIMMRKILRNPNTFYIVIVRNFVDMVWSAYNYWCDPSVDHLCDTATYWTDPKSHHRSPNHFHSIVTSDSIGPSRVRSPCSLARNVYSFYISSLSEHVPHEGMIVVSSEQLESSPELIWKRLVDRAGIPSTPEPNFDNFKRVRFNTQIQSERGADVSVNQTDYVHGKYTITGNKGIREDTRMMLDKCWHDDCVEVSRLTDYQYPACGDNRQTINQSHADIHAASSQRGSFQKALDYKILTFKNTMQAVHETYKISQYQGFLKGQLHSRCGNESFTSSQTNQPSTPPGSMGTVSPLLPRLITDKFNLKTAFFSDQALVFLSSRRDRDLFRALVYLSTNDASYFDAVEDYQKTWAKEACESATSIFVVKSQIEVAEISDQINMTALRFKDHLTSPCPHRYFTRVIISRHDVLGDIWSSFLRNYVKKNIYGIPKFRGSFMEWKKWDREVVNIVKTTVNHSTDPFLEYEPLVGKMRSDRKLLLQFSHVSSYELINGTLRSILQFIKPEIDRSMTTLQLRCTFTLAQPLMIFDSHQFFDHYQHFQDAYISNDLLHLIAEKSGDYSFIKTEKRQDFHNFSSRVEYLPASHSHNHSDNCSRTYERIFYRNNFSHDMDLSSCTTMFHRRAYLDELHHHVVALVGGYQQETINTRLLFEYATGTYTGSVIGHKPWADTFVGEMACGQRLGLVHVRWSEGMSLPVHDKKPTIRLSPSQRKKCMRGMVRGFGRAILLVKDPFVDIWEQFLVLKSFALNDASPAIDDDDWKRSALEIAHQYSTARLQLIPFHGISANFNASDVFVVSHEALTYIGTVGNHSFDTRYDMAWRLIQFSGHEEQCNADSIRCAYNFIDLGDSLRAMDTMIRHYLRVPGLICTVQGIVTKMIDSPLFVHHIFHSILC